MFQPILVSKMIFKDFYLFFLIYLKMSQNPRGEHGNMVIKIVRPKHKVKNHMYLVGWNSMSKTT